MRDHLLRNSVAVAIMLAALACPAQTAPRVSGSRAAAPTGATLTVDGYTGEVPIVLVNGRSYIDLEVFSRIVNASVRLQGSRLALTLPAQSAPSTAPTSQTVPAAGNSSTSSESGFSRDFVSASVVAVSAIREWRATLVNAVRSNFPVTDDLTASYRRNSEAQVALALAAARNAQDRSAGALMQTELANMRTLNATLIGAHDSVANIRNDAMDTDPLSIRTQNCLAALGGISVGGQFQDVPSCH